MYDSTWNEAWRTALGLLAYLGGCFLLGEVVYWVFPDTRSAAALLTGVHLPEPAWGAICATPIAACYLVEWAHARRVRLEQRPGTRP